MWLIATYGAGPKNVIAIFDTAEAPTRGTHLALLRWSAARKTGCNRSRQTPLPWSDGTTEPNGWHSNFSVQENFEKIPGSAERLLERRFRAPLSQ